MAIRAGGVRKAAVAGMFYPEDPVELGLLLEELLEEARQPATGSNTAGREGEPLPHAADAVAEWPKGLIVPHAGYVYSGPVAASGYARLWPGREVIRRVVLLGPSHRRPIDGLAASSAGAFETPLGLVRIDDEFRSRALELPHVSTVDEAHEKEHSLEVQLPFLQRALLDFQIVPLLVGKSTPEEVATVIRRLWGGPETLIVVSSDLSHFHDDATAKSIDGATARFIEACEENQLSGQRACGYLPVAGLLQTARHYRLKVRNVDLRTSADTAGRRDRVVGYGAFIVAEEPAIRTQRQSASNETAQGPLQPADGSTVDSGERSPVGPGAGLGDGVQSPSLDGIVTPAAPRLALDAHPQPPAHSAEERQLLLRIAADAIRMRATAGRSQPFDWHTVPRRLRELGAAFVTLRRNGRLRGCVGSVQATEMLAENVARSAIQAAFADRRFPRLDAKELAGLEIHVSILTPTRPIVFLSEEELACELRPGIDGVTLREGARFGLFLPSVWRQVPDAVQFLRHLKRKVGLPEDYWSQSIECERFQVEEFEGVIGDADGQLRCD